MGPDADPRPMTRAELERHAALLFGSGWQTALARRLEIADRTVRRWVADDSVPAWAAERVRAMVHIAPPPGSTWTDDRDDACADALERYLSRMVELAESAGWHRAEIDAAILSLTVSDMLSHAGPDATMETLRQAIAAVNAAR